MFRASNHGRQTSFITKFKRLDSSVRTQRLWQTLLLCGPLLLSAIASIVKTYVSRVCTCWIDVCTHRPIASFGVGKQVGLYLEHCAVHPLGQVSGIRHAPAMIRIDTSLQDRRLLHSPRSNFAYSPSLHPNIHGSKRCDSERVWKQQQRPTIPSHWPSLGAEWSRSSSFDHSGWR